MTVKSEVGSSYRICARCIMDTSDSDIEFDGDGLCNHCRRLGERMKTGLHIDEEGQRRLQVFVERIKAEGKNKEYDCIIGLSGGVDSSAVAHIVKKLGLRPLAVHLDNGWDSELAVSNVEKLVKKLDLDLFSLVLDWELFKDLHLAFLKASVINSEVPTDHAITATLYQLAVKKGVRYIISGSNLATEGIMPLSWGYLNLDWKHIKGVHDRFGVRKLKGYPHLTLFHWAYYTFVKRIKIFPILNYVDYNKEAFKRLLASEYGWKDYGGKHYESVYTRFFQGYILPMKFHVDKRRAHLSAMICSGQMNREDALEEMEKASYPADMLTEDKPFVLKKLGLSAEEFEQVLALPSRSFRDYPNNYFWIRNLRGLVDLAKRRATSA
ncbi:MAG: N-acetyl sugar amidotransferase [Dehalococcoidia bacterium]|nr:N-acetyl sugar amidotransferase [Dehalococcoidia bacterium]